MDSVGSDPFRAALHQQEERISHNEGQLSSVFAGIRELSERHQSFQAGIGSQVNKLSSQFEHFVSKLVYLIPAAAPVSAVSAPLSVSPVTPIATAASAAPFIHLVKPGHFSGESKRCRTFLVQVSSAFRPSRGFLSLGTS